MLMTTHTLSVDVGHLAVGELLDLFQTLDAPSIAEMHGEYAARLLRQPGPVAHLVGHGLVSNPIMRWLCKAFRPVDAESGRGYNTFRIAGRVVQRFPMQTRLAPSRYDGKPAYHLIYGAYRSLCGDIHMVDEVRQLARGVYLGMGTWGFTDSQRRIALPFLLEGPVDKYRGDIGELRSGFEVGKREIPRLTI